MCLTWSYKSCILNIYLHTTISRHIPVLKQTLFNICGVSTALIPSWNNISHSYLYLYKITSNIWAKKNLCQNSSASDWHFRNKIETNLFNKQHKNLSQNAITDVRDDACLWGELYCFGLLSKSLCHTQRQHGVLTTFPHRPRRSKGAQEVGAARSQRTYCAFTAHSLRVYSAHTASWQRAHGAFTARTRRFRSAHTALSRRSKRLRFLKLFFKQDIFANILSYLDFMKQFEYLYVQNVLSHTGFATLLETHT